MNNNSLRWKKDQILVAYEKDHPECPRDWRGQRSGLNQIIQNAVEDIVYQCPIGKINISSFYVIAARYKLKIRVHKGRKSFYFRVEPKT